MIGFDRRKLEGQVVLGQSIRHAVLVKNRKRLAPIALAAEDGIAQAKGRLALAQLFCFQLRYHLLRSLRHRQPIQQLRIHQCSLLSLVGQFGLGLAVQHRNDGQCKMLRKSIVAAVVRRHPHHRASAIAGQHVVCHPDRQRLPGQWMGGVRAGEHPRDALHVCQAVSFRSFCGLFHIRCYRRLLLRRGQRLHIGVLRRQRQISHTKERIWAGRKYLYRVGCAVGRRGSEGDGGAGRLADPVALHFFDRGWPV